MDVSQSSMAQFGAIKARENTLKPQLQIMRVYEVEWTPFMVACQMASLQIVEILLDSGASQELKSLIFRNYVTLRRLMSTPKIQTPLWWAAANGHETVVRC
ncbi:hypothetical protein EDB80DRAFT_871853 [Ilyonectria destructans]|nr:hypothetical protein EDB80DRAFT_871853 [Ilyonectria destructans]